MRASESSTVDKQGFGHYVYSRDFTTVQELVQNALAGKTGEAHFGIESAEREVLSFSAVALPITYEGRPAAMRSRVI